jgi:hypothetical protein
MTAAPGGGQHRVLPPLAQLSGEQHGRAGDRADRRRPGALQKGPGGRVAAQAVEPRPPDEHERERRREGDQRRQQRGATPPAAYPTAATVPTTGPGVTCPSATAVRNCGPDIQP